MRTGRTLKQGKSEKKDSSKEKRKKKRKKNGLSSLRGITRSGSTLENFADGREVVGGGWRKAEYICLPQMCTTQSGHVRGSQFSAVIYRGIFARYGKIDGCRSTLGRCAPR